MKIPVSAKISTVSYGIVPTSKRTARRADIIFDGQEVRSDSTASPCCGSKMINSEPEFVNLLRSLGIDS
jgi:hypothetical protein